MFWCNILQSQLVLWRMSKIVNIDAYRSRALDQRSFGPWRKRFGESYHAKSLLSDLSDKTLYYLALPGDNSTFAFYELIMGILDLGAAPKFHYLDNKDQLKVVDMHLFLADQVRFEMMRRLGWLESFPSSKYTILALVQRLEEIKLKNQGIPPQLSKAHPEYSAFLEMTSGDKEVFVRRMLQEALDAFKIGISD
jgi:hypothetical protein